MPWWAALVYFKWSAVRAQGVIGVEAAAVYKLAYHHTAVGLYPACFPRKRMETVLTGRSIVVWGFWRPVVVKEVFRVVPRCNGLEGTRGLIEVETIREVVSARIRVSERS